MVEAERKRIARGIELMMECCDFAEDGCGSSVVAITELSELIEWVEAGEPLDELRKRFIKSAGHGHGYFGRSGRCQAKLLSEQTWEEEPDG